MYPIGSFDIFSCWGVSVERILTDLYMRMYVFAGVHVCVHVRQWSFQRLLPETKPV